MPSRPTASPPSPRPGGTGAVRQAFELIRLATPEATVWVSDPTWPNHLSILNYLGMPIEPYRYFDADTRGVDFAAMMADLAAAKPGDVVLLHGCCHNPTGANLTLPEWAEVAALLEKTGAVPMIDIAYQGFGDGLDADAAGVRLIAGRLPEVLIAASCSKNFGIYRERTGALMALSDPAKRERDARHAGLPQPAELLLPARPRRPAGHDDPRRPRAARRLAGRAGRGARSACCALREHARERAATLSGSDRFGFLAQHRGMFSRLGASPEQVERLKTEHGIYMVGDSRLNIAGLNATTVPVLARAILAVGI